MVNLWKQGHRSQGLSLPVKEGPLHCGTDGQCCQGKLYSHAPREKSKTEEERSAGDTSIEVWKAALLTSCDNPS